MSTFGLGTSHPGERTTAVPGGRLPERGVGELANGCANSGGLPRDWGEANLGLSVGRTIREAQGPSRNGCVGQKNQPNCRESALVSAVPAPHSRSSKISMVRRGSTVRVRQGALFFKKCLHIGHFRCLGQHPRAPPASTRQLSENRAVGKGPANRRGASHARAPPWYGGGRQFESARGLQKKPAMAFLLPRCETFDP